MALSTLFLTTTLQLGLPPRLLDSICYVESRYDTLAIHIDDGNGNSLGVCQIKYSTAKGLGYLGTERQLLNPTLNIYYAGLYLKHQILRYNSISRAIIAYNKGHAGVLTTTRYQRKVYKEWSLGINALDVADIPVHVELTCQKHQK